MAEHGPGVDGEAAAAPEASWTPAFPWPPPEEAGLGGAARAFGRTWSESTLRPASFFAALPADRGTGAALLYYLIVGVAAAAATLFWRTIFLAFDPESAAMAGVPADAASALTDFLLSPLFLLALLLLSALAVHVPLLVLGGARGGFGATLRVLCFAYGPQVLAVVPAIGNLVGFVWMVVLAIVGLREAHRTDGWKAALAVLLPVAAALGLALLAVLAALAVVGAGLGAGG